MEPLKNNAKFDEYGEATVNAKYEELTKVTPEKVEKALNNAAKAFWDLGLEFPIFRLEPEQYDALDTKGKGDLEAIDTNFGLVGLASCASWEVPKAESCDIVMTFSPTEFEYSGKKVRVYGLGRDKLTGEPRLLLKEQSEL